MYVHSVILEVVLASTLSTHMVARGRYFQISYIMGMATYQLLCPEVTHKEFARRELETEPVVFDFTVGKVCRSLLSV